jgi:hypothetical protein
MAKLTTRTLASGVTVSDLIHIVIPSDISQDPAGSSYKASIQQVFDAYPSVAITGGTYNSGTGTITITNSTGGTVNITGVTSGSVFTGGTVPGATIFSNGVTASTLSASTLFVNGVQITGDTYVTGGTFSIDTITFTNNQGGTFTVTGLTTGGSSVFTGGTVNGPTNFTNGLSANTISATTYYNLPGSSSGNCFVDFYVRNVHGCSPISIWDETQTNGSNAYGILSFSLGNNSKTYGDYSHANGFLTETGSNNGYLLTGCTAGICAIESTYGDVSSNFSTGISSFVFFDDTSYSSLYPSYVFAVSAVTFDGTNTIVYLYDTSVDTLGDNAIMSDTNGPSFWGGNQVFGGHYGNASGISTYAIGIGSTSKGSGSYSIGQFSSAEGQSYSYGGYSHAEGFFTTASGNYSHSEGSGSNAIGIGSHAEGTNTQAIGSSSHAEGTNSVASGQFSHSEGSSTASGIFSHAQGDSSVASGQYAHSQNKGTQAIGGSTHAGGFGGIARGEVSFSHGVLTEANGPTTAVLGGDLNIISSGGTYGSAILGGSGNTITYVSLTDDVRSSAIIGGSGNTVTSFESVIIGGEFNNVTAPRSVILGGANITANASDTTYVPNFVIAESYTPASSLDTVGEPGSITWDNTYLYYKTNTGWKRLNGSTF